jgi:hypothetical protein
MLHIRFLDKDFLGLVAKGFDLGFLNVLTTLQLLNPLIDVKALLFGSHVLFKLIIYYIF